MDKKNDGVWAGFPEEWLIAEEPKPAKQQEVWDPFAASPDQVASFNLESYKTWILSYVECAENNRANGFSDRYNRSQADTALRIFREKCAARLKKAKADMNDPLALFPDAEITALSDLGLPEASFLYVEKYADPYQWNVWDEDHLKRLELAVRFGFADSAMTQKAQKMLGDLYWKTGKALHEKGKPEGMERIRKAESYGNTEAKKFLAPPKPAYTFSGDLYSSVPYETIFRHYLTNEKIFEQDGKYYTESGKEVGFGELD